ncbi:MAG: hypothetical protein GY852_09030, partial [bacterium]|nr:hypothetical protein [bacterium]
MYGTDHQITKKACLGLHDKFQKALACISPLTIHVEEQSLFCESWKVEKKKFAIRLANRFKSAGIQSVAFEKGLSAEAISLFIIMLNDPTDYVNVESMKEAFKEKGVGGVRLNFITFRKVQDDEIVVRENFGEFAQVLSVGHIVSQSESVAKNLRAQIQSGGPALLVDYLIKLKKRIPHGVIDSKKLPPPNEILESLTALRKGIIEDLQTDSTTGIIDKTGEEAVREMDNLADEVLIKIIVEEYRAGLKSPKELALLVRRLIPDAVSLKRLMPRIKDILLKEGMSLSDYLEMVRALANELQEDSVIEILKEAGEEIGVSAAEIVKDLKRNPQAAARLIILASEIRSYISDSDDEFIEILSDFIERVSMKMTRETLSASGDIENGNIEEALSSMENELLKDLGLNGIEQVHIDSIGTRLAKRLPEAVVQLKYEIVNEEDDHSGEAHADTGFDAEGGSGKATLLEKGIPGMVPPAGEESPRTVPPGRLKDTVANKGSGGSKRVAGIISSEINIDSGLGIGGEAGEGTAGVKGIAGGEIPDDERSLLSGTPGYEEDGIGGKGGGGSEKGSVTGTGAKPGSGFGTGTGEGTAGVKGITGGGIPGDERSLLSGTPGYEEDGIGGKGGGGS